MSDDRPRTEAGRIDEIVAEFKLDREQTSENDALRRLARAFARAEAAAGPRDEGLREALRTALAVINVDDDRDLSLFIEELEAQGYVLTGRALAATPAPEADRE